MKPRKSYEEQLSILKSRGCIVNDDAACIYSLSTINYYRLSHYFYLFREKDYCGEEKYKAGTDFHKILRIYEFDVKLRDLLTRALGKIEIFFRTQVAYIHTSIYGEIGYLRSDIYYDMDRHCKFMSKFNESLHSNKDKYIVRHQLEKYGRLPLWVAVELFSFGTLSKFYNNWKFEDQRVLSSSFYQYTNPKNRKDLWGKTYSLILCCSVLRNECAHYNRIYGSSFSKLPGFLDKKYYAVDNSLFTQILAMRACYPGTDEWNESFILPLKELIQEYSEFIELDLMGFPQNWEELLKK